MSPESNGPKPDSQEPGPPLSGTATRQSARAPSAWGATRDALAAVYNLESLLRSSSVLYRTILDLLPELRSSASVLRDAFDRVRGGDAAADEVGAYGAGRVDELVRLLDATALADDERDDLADRARTLADELEASADLLVLLERAADPAPTDVNVDLVVRETVRLSRSARGREVVVRFDGAAPEGTVHVDPYVAGPLLSLLVASLHAAGVEPLAVRARYEEAAATFAVEPAGSADAGHAALAMRVLPAVPPAAVAARHAASRIGAALELDLEGRRGTLRLPRSPG